jgi:hypothetical protein
MIVDFEHINYPRAYIMASGLLLHQYSVCVCLGGEGGFVCYVEALETQHTLMGPYGAGSTVHVYGRYKTPFLNQSFPFGGLCPTSFFHLFDTINPLA